MAISKIIQETMKDSSWIRKMFETGQELRQRFGDHNVFDFSLGSPLLDPPEAFNSALLYLTSHPKPGMHRYMPNNGFLSTRQVVAKNLSEQEHIAVDPADLVMTVGAAGAANVAMAALLDPGDEVIILAPYFVEYLFYPRNHGGIARMVDTTTDFDLDIEAIDAAINERTKAIIINSPNNPTGRIYSQQRMSELALLLQRREAQYGKEIYIISDTPYARITYDGKKNPRFFMEHPSTLIAHSFSKDLGLAGERIGYLAINPRAPHRTALRSACTFTNRTLGFVNAPALMQRALEHSMEATVDVDQYRILRDLICAGLTDAGYEYYRPEGAFFLFMKSPIPDDVAFAKALLEENVLAVPGSGFGRAGHLRVAYCVPQKTIEGAMPRFARVRKRVQEQR